MICRRRIPEDVRSLQWLAPPEGTEIDSSGVNAVKIRGGVAFSDASLLWFPSSDNG